MHQGKSKSLEVCHTSKFALCINGFRNISFARLIFSYFSIIIKFKCLLKLCPTTWKCLHVTIAFRSFASFVWLFNLILKAVLAFPTYCLLHIVTFYQIDNNWLLQFTFSKICKTLSVCWLFKFVVDITCA